ncbi:MAG: hypothetical protein A3G24_16105 [Betaproteobacteria bacterium RIFCSPLOWO2_12_FULL_62_13]|nr:MAG: hypothetical protein A3G24_16105 [Betaproteobacteria bacterium RIFCSPLOWO2_12_FULL_62_13]
MSESIETEPILDYRYFKFRTINKYLIESLVNSRLYFAKPNKLNDPFDCRLDLRKSFSRAASSATGIRKTWLQSRLNDGQEFIEKWEGSFENFGICSFSLKLHTTLMWSHYADEHRGVCLLYRFPESFFLAPQNKIFGVDKVKYSDDALTDWLKNEAPMELNKFVPELIKIYLTAKSPAWHCESEARVIRKEHGFIDIPFGFLEQVCFGLRTPQADIDLITKLAREYGGCQNFCRIIRDESDFGISAEEM